MSRAVFVKGFVAESPRFRRPQQESIEWLTAAYARAAATRSRREDSISRWEERVGRLLKRYSCRAEHIGWRSSEIEDYMHTDWPRMRIFNLHENPMGQAMGARNAFYAETVNRIVESLFAADSEPPSDLLHVSCTGYISPSSIQRLIELKRWNGWTQPTHVYQMGCHAALPALRIAAGLLSRRNGKIPSRAEVVHTELCTLHFNPCDYSPGQLIIQTLFADGHIRYSIVQEDRTGSVPGAGALEVLSMREELVPESLSDMTWSLSEWGFQMTLSRDVPGKIAAVLPRFLSDLFSDAGLAYAEEAGDSIFAVHPGGPRILDSIEEVLKLEKRQLESSRAVLFQRGNMSSATLPHIWMHVSADGGVKPGTLVTSVAFGPGLTIAGALFRKC